MQVGSRTSVDGDDDYDEEEGEEPEPEIPAAVAEEPPAVPPVVVASPPDPAPAAPSKVDLASQGPNTINRLGSKDIGTGVYTSSIKRLKH